MTSYDDLFALVSDDQPLLDFQLRAMIAEYAVARNRLTRELGNRNVVGQLGELYVAVGLEGRLRRNSNKGFDVIVPSGERVQVKTREIGGAGADQFGGFTSLSIIEGQFDQAVFVRLDA